jgi:hypothetical protein
MDSEDQRVAAVACNAILDRAFGRPRVAEETKDDFLARLQVMTPEGRVRMAEELLERGARYVHALEGAQARSRRLRLTSEATPEQNDGTG